MTDAVSSRRSLVRARRFFTRDLWTAEPASRGARFLFRLLRMTVLVFEGSVQSDVFLLSAGLTYQIIFSLIPLLAVTLAFFRAFGKMEGTASDVKTLVLEKFLGPAGKELVEYIDNFVAQTNETTLGIVGVAVLLVSAFSLLTSMEKSFNKVWGVLTFRPLLRRFTIYWTILTVAPLFLGLSIAASSFLQTKVAEHVPFLGDALLRLGPFVFTWIVFAILLALVPNTRVNASAAFAGAVVAGTLWEVAKIGYVWYNVRFVSVEKVYGSLGVIPVFLLWVYISWALVLFGAEISYAFQNVQTYRREVESPIVSQAYREKLGVVVVLEASRAFLDGQVPPTAASLATGFRLPRRPVNEVVHQLVSKNILREFARGSKGDPDLVPASDPESVLVKDVVRALREYGSEPGGLPEGTVFGDLEQVLRENFKALCSRKEGVSGEERGAGPALPRPPEPWWPKRLAIRLSALFKRRRQQ